MGLTQLHNLVGNSFALFSLLITLWALINYLRNRPLGGDFWGAVVIGEGLMVAQAGLGAIMMAQGAFPREWVHLLYGVLALMVWPSTYGLARNQPQQRETLYWMVASGFLFGVALRAYFTGLGL